MQDDSDTSNFRVDSSNQKATRGAQVGNQNAQKSGLYALKRTISELGGRVIDKRYRTGKALHKWQAELVADIGGDPSTQQKVLVDLCVRGKLLLDSIDVWLLSQKSLISYRKRALIPVVKERQVIADGLTRNLQLLGLNRVMKDLNTIDDYMERADTDEAKRKRRQEGNSKPESTEYPTADDPGDIKDREVVDDGTRESST